MQALNWPEGMRPILDPGGHRSSNPHTGYAGRWTSEGLENCVALRREVRAEGRVGGAPYRSPACRCAGEAGNGVQACGSRRPGNRRRWTGADRPALTGTDASAASFWVFVLGVRSGRSFWMFVLGVRDNVPGLVPDLIRELECQAAADAALNPDARNIPGTEDRPALPRNLPQSPGERSERGFSPITTPGGPEKGGNAAVGIRGAAPARLSTATLPPPPEILRSGQRSGTGEGVE